MSKSLKVFSFPDRNPEYLQLQIDSYKKFMGNADSELIIINASMQHEDEINQICKDNRVNCIKFEGQKEGPIGYYYIRQFHWFRDTVQKETSDNILLMHSDMFFINQLDYKPLMDKYQIYYNPQYKNKFTGYPQVDYNYVWDGTILFNSQYFNENDLTKHFIWNPLPVPNSNSTTTDMGGMMKYLLDNIKHKNIHSYIEFWNYTEIKNNIIDTHLNGNVRYFVNVEDNTFNIEPILLNRSFEYEKERQDYKEYYVQKFRGIKKTFVDPYNFPDPVHIDIIQTIDKDITKGFLLHFKSGTGYQTFYNAVYRDKKLKEIEKIINRQI